MGMAMERLNLPMFAQPLHLWLASLILGVQWAIYLIIKLGDAKSTAGLQYAT